MTLIIRTQFFFRAASLREEEFLFDLDFFHSSTWLFVDWLCESFADLSVALSFFLDSRLPLLLSQVSVHVAAPGFEACPEEHRSQEWVRWNGSQREEKGILLLALVGEFQFFLCHREL